MAKMTKRERRSLEIRMSETKNALRRAERADMIARGIYMGRPCVIGDKKHSRLDKAIRREMVMSY